MFSSYKKDYPFIHELSEQDLDSNSSLKKMLQLIENKKTVLEFGCATGYFSKLLLARGCEVTRIEINEAGSLTRFLTQLPGHTLKVYPELDIMGMALADLSFDLVIHSDVLEHIKHPIRGLSECYRVLKYSGYCAFTVPIIVDRLTASREGLPPSYHGCGDNRPDYLAYTEYGCDAWKHFIQAGFQECRLFSIDYPSAQALVGVK
jgi:SAM-dependent methyltransferase